MSSDDVFTASSQPRQMAAEGEKTESLPSEMPVEVDDRPFVADADRYELLGTIGKGGMGEIRLAKDTRIARQVAIKVLNPELRDQRDFRSRFLVEARLQGQLEHPAIVPVHDLGETPDGELFFSMKCVRGVTLQEALGAAQRGDQAQAARFSRRRLLTAFSSVCLAIDFAHSRGVVHRDLKPSNIMLGDFGEVYILDWGIAKLVDTPDTPIENPLEIPGSGDWSTSAGSVLGTLEYMAPELQMHRIANRRTDVFALGVILRRLLAADATHEAPPELVTIVGTATAADPEKRYRTARELHEVIEHYLDGDRDLQLRRAQAEAHADAAELALGRADAIARSDAGREIGRALGLDPSNERAMRTLMRLLSEVPAQMPPGAQTEIDRVWQRRRSRTLRIATLLATSVVLYVPFILWMGVRDWRLFGAWLALTIGAAVGQLIASRNEHTLPFVIATVCAVGELAVLTTSMGITGMVPASLAVIAAAWRMTVRRWVHGVIVLAAIIIATCLPLLLPALGLMSATYAVRDDTLVLLPHMHHLPATATQIALLLGTIGALTAAYLFGRIYEGEIRRAEERLTFQAWQLQQLLVPAR